MRASYSVFGLLVTNTLVSSFIPSQIAQPRVKLVTSNSQTSPRSLPHQSLSTTTKTQLYAKLWERLQIEEDPEPFWYLLNCVATNELDLLRQCRAVCEGMKDVEKFVVPTERKTRSHGANKMVTEIKVKYPGYVFAKLRLCPETYEAIQGLDLCRSWMGTVNHKGYKKLPPCPVALNEVEIENFGLEDLDDSEDFQEDGLVQETEDGVILDDSEEEEYSDPMYKNIDRSALKQYRGLKVEDMVKVTKEGKFFNEDGIVRRLKDGQIFVRFYTYGTMFEEWLDPSAVRKLSDEEVLNGLSGPSQPITQRDFDGPDSYQRQGGRPGDLRSSLMSNVRRPGGDQRNRRQDRTADRYSNQGRGESEYDRRRERNNWNWYKEQQENKDGQTVADDQWTMRGSGNPNDNDNWAAGDVDSQWGRKPARQQRKEQKRFNNREDNRQNEAAIDGTDDWSAFVSPAASAGAGSDSSSGPADDFFSSLMTDLSKDLDSPRGNSYQTRSQQQSSQSRESDEDDFFASLMSELSQETAKKESTEQNQPRMPISSTAKPAQDDDFFASLEAELGSALDEDTSSTATKTADKLDDFFSQLEADLSTNIDTKSNEDSHAKAGEDVTKAKSSAKKQSTSSTSGSTRSELYQHTVPVLKDMLRERGLKVSGKKAELVERLLESS